jgi:hypothetical protein
MFRRQFLRTTGAAICFTSIAGVARAADILLSVETNGAGLRTFTDDELLALPQFEFTTSTIWTEGALTFSGPSLADVLAAAGVTSGDIEMTAVNDYAVAMPRSRLEPAAPIIANRINGSPFGVRDKGPLWLVFPYDSADRYQSEEIYSYSVWQLTQIKAVQG